jgi:Co/Zn/Cd efflux system component
VLVINLSFFAIEMISGFVSWSMGLLADSLDMLADAVVYGMALMAVGGSLIKKKKIAKYAGLFQMILASVGFFEALRRFLGFERIPEFHTMIFVSAGALIANGICLYLLQKSRSKEAHMQASMIFTSNDIIINAGVIIAGIIVFLSDSNLPDLIIGTLVFGIVIRGAVRILKLSK